MSTDLTEQDVRTVKDEAMAYLQQALLMCKESGVKVAIANDYSDYVHLADSVWTGQLVADKIKSGEQPSPGNNTGPIDCVFIGTDEGAYEVENDDDNVILI